MPVDRQLPAFRLARGDCLKLMAGVASDSVDLILADLPYGSTANRWDRRIDPDRVWEHYQRVVALGGAIVLTADIRFGFAMYEAAPPGWFRYDLVWDKGAPVGFLDCNRRPLRRHELILVFGPRPTRYRPQMGRGSPYRKPGHRVACTSYGDQRKANGPRPANDGSRYPTSILAITNANVQVKGKVHPTMKPPELMDRLIRTYSDPGDVVMDNAMGSGKTGEAAILAGRHFIGFEADPAHYARAVARIEAARLSLGMSPPPAAATLPDLTA